MLNAQMYTSKPLPRDFKLCGDPYKEDKAKEELRSMGVMFYRDENHVDGLMLIPPLTEITKGLYSQLILNSEFQVDEWSGQPEAVFKKNGDYLCWIQFNKHVDILDMNAEIVRVQR